MRRTPSDTAAANMEFWKFSWQNLKRSEVLIMRGALKLFTEIDRYCSCLCAGVRSLAPIMIRFMSRSAIAFNLMVMCPRHMAMPSSASNSPALGLHSTQLQPLQELCHSSGKRNVMLVSASHFACEMPVCLCSVSQCSTSYLVPVRPSAAQHLALPRYISCVAAPCFRLLQHTWQQRSAVSRWICSFSTHDSQAWCTTGAPLLL